MVIFFFLLCLLTLFLYAAGTIQGFVDSTQLSLLSFYTVLGIFLTVSSLYAAVISIRRFIKAQGKKAGYLIMALGYFLLVIFGIATELIITFVINVVKGSGGALL